MVESISEIIERVSPYYKKKGGPEVKHNILYDSPAEALEPVYFFLVDLMSDFGLKPEKLVDNFSATPGSQQFSEIGMKSSRLQDEAMKIMGSINTVLRSILNIVYDLKDFKIRLDQYEGLKSNDRSVIEASKLSLKQIWMDKVDISRGNSSIKAMALGQGGFQTLIDAFLVVDREQDVDKLDLNDMVKRVVKPRIHEFNQWVIESEKQLKKRYEIERSYLRSQVNSLKIYSRWVKPYLKNASMLESKEMGRSTDLVNMFNTLVMELTLFGKSKLDIESSALSGDLPKNFLKFKPRRDYYSCLLVDFKFRAIPTQGRMVGRVEINFRGYALNDDEIAKLDEEIDKSDLGDMLQLIQGATDDSLDQLEEEINYFLEDNPEEEKETKKEIKDESNPFLALIGWYSSSPKNEKEEGAREEGWEVEKDDWIEKEHLRRCAINSASGVTFAIFDIYKKSHGMPSYT